ARCRTTGPGRSVSPGAGRGARPGRGVCGHRRGHAAARPHGGRTGEGRSARADPARDARGHLWGYRRRSRADDARVPPPRAARPARSLDAGVGGVAHHRRRGAGHRRDRRVARLQPRETDHRRPEEDDELRKGGRPVGKGSTQIQRDIERKRYTLSQRIEELDRRIREDLDKTRSEAQSRIQSVGDRAKGRAKGPAEKAKDRAAGIREQAGSLNERIGESPVGQHPNLLLAGSFAAGVALGMATGGGGDDRYEEEREEPPAWFREYAALRQESF